MGAEKSLQISSQDAQSQLLKAARKQDLTESAEVFLPPNVPVAEGVCSANRMLPAITYKQSRGAKTTVCAGLPRLQGSPNTSEQKFPVYTMRYPTKPRQPVWQPALGNPIYRSPTASAELLKSSSSSTFPLQPHCRDFPRSEAIRNRDVAAWFRVLTQGWVST